MPLTNRVFRSINRKAQEYQRTFTLQLFPPLTHFYHSPTNRPKLAKLHTSGKCGVLHWRIGKAKPLFIHIFAKCALYFQIETNVFRLNRYTITYIL